MISALITALGGKYFSCLWFVLLCCFLPSFFFLVKKEKIIFLIQKNSVSPCTQQFLHLFFFFSLAFSCKMWVVQLLLWTPPLELLGVWTPLRKKPGTEQAAAALTSQLASSQVLKKIISNVYCLKSDGGKKKDKFVLK